MPSSSRKPLAPARKMPSSSRKPLPPFAKPEIIDLSSDFLAIPKDVIQLIAGYIDRPSLLNLSRTCRQMERAIRPIVYSKLVFPPRSQYNAPANPRTSKMYILKDPKTGDDIVRALMSLKGRDFRNVKTGLEEKMVLVNTLHLSIDDFTNHPLTVKPSFNYYNCTTRLGAITLHDDRGNCIACRIPVGGDSRARILLQTLSTRLERLVINGVPEGSIVNSIDEEVITRDFCSNPIILPKVTYLQSGVDPRHILPLTPNLKTLVVQMDRSMKYEINDEINEDLEAAEEGDWLDDDEMDFENDGDDMRSSVRRSSGCTAGKTCPHCNAKFKHGPQFNQPALKKISSLTSITFRINKPHISISNPQRYPSIISDVLATAQNLKEFRYIVPSMGLKVDDGHYHSYEKFRHAKIEHLVWVGQHFAHQLSEPRFFANLRKLVIELKSMDEQQCRLETLPEIHLDKLEHLVLVIGGRGWGNGVARPLFDEARTYDLVSINSQAVLRLNDMPCLTTIEFIPAYADEAAVTIRPETWEYAKHRGIAIRTYRSGQHTLTHTRTYSRSFQVSFESDPAKEDLRGRVVNIQKDKDKEEWSGMAIGKQFTWKEGAEYDGCSVPGRVLALVYQIAGEGLKWKTGGRDMELPPRAWRVLEKWKEAEGFA